MMSFRLLQLGGAVLGACVYLANQSQVKALTAEAEHLDEELAAEESGPRANGDPPDRARGCGPVGQGQCRAGSR